MILQKAAMLSNYQLKKDLWTRQLFVSGDCLVDTIMQTQIKCLAPEKNLQGIQIHLA